jgi:hypothetical protein
MEPPIQSEPLARPNGIDVTLAMARERLGEAYFTQAVAFLDFTTGELAPPRALSIYARLLHLSEEEYRAVKNRVLASYGEALGSMDDTPTTFVAINGDVEWDITASLFKRIRRRLEGRRNYRLRKRVEVFIGHVEGVLLGIHVDCVLRMIRHFDANTSVAEVIRIYMEELNVRRGVYHSIHVNALDRMFEELRAAEEDTEADEQALDAAPEERGVTRLLAPSQEERRGNDRPLRMLP